LIPFASWAQIKLNHSPIASVPKIVPVAQVKLNTWTSPSQGFAGTTQVNLTGSGFPGGVIPPGNVTITVAASCGGAALATATAIKVTPILGSSDRIEFLIPASLAGQTDQVSIKGTTSTGALFVSNCSSLKVLSKAVVSSCLPSSSLGVLLPATGPGPVTAYVPNGAWASATNGIQVVPVEGGGSPVPVGTANAVNSCSSNSGTGQSVCVANNTDVYLLTGSTLTTTLTSASDTLASFSGGSCQNCGVTINGKTNTAVIAMGLSTAPSLTGFQFLDLGTNTFGAPVPAANYITEDAQWDPGRNLLLSPNEYGTYDLFDTSQSPPAEFGNFIGAGEFDSSAEDCTTGIALSAIEFTGNLFITDLTQATFTPGSPGTWTAPSQTTSFPEFVNFAAGTSGIAVAPGSHLALAAGEFGGNMFGVVVLPSTSGSGTPAFGDYVACSVPNTPDGAGWQQGLDPHTMTAYVSPNNGRALGLMANYPPPNWLALIDLAGVLSAPRLTGTHTCDPSYDLVAHGVVAFIATH